MADDARPPRVPPTSPHLEQHGDEYTVRWPDHDVTIVCTGIQESKGTVDTEIRVNANGSTLHWAKLNLAAGATRSQLVHKLNEFRLTVPWKFIVEETCRTVVERAREGRPVVAVVPTPWTGPRYLVAPMLPIGETTILHGDGGSGKSWLALTLAAGICGHWPVPPPLVLWGQGPVLYLDWESTVTQLEARAWHLGGGQPLPGLYYKAMMGPVHAEIGTIRAEVSRKGIVAVIVDSLAPAAGAEPEGADAATRTMNALRTLDGVTRIVIAHVSKQAADGVGSPRPYGSVFNQNIARSVWGIQAREEGDDLVLDVTNPKVNEGRKHAPFALRAQFQSNRVVWEAAAVRPPEVRRSDAGALPDQIHAWLLRDGPQTTPGVAEEFDLSANMARAILSRLKERGRVIRSATRPRVWSAK